MPRKLLMLSVLSLALTACGGSGGSPKPASAGTKTPPRGSTRQPTPVRAPVHAPPPKAQVLALPGLEGVIGSTRDDLTRQFGPARPDVWEGDARKLQFSGTACVLDVYLYPTSSGREPQAT